MFSRALFWFLMGFTVFYAMTNRKHGRLQLGVTTNPWQQIAHQQYEGSPTLVYYEVVRDIEMGIDRKDAWKLMGANKRRALISVVNPEWEDLCPALYCEIGRSGKLGGFNFEEQEWW